ncbi:hypothetical protein RM553_10130, partial [Zunongwangia sp. F363]
MSEIGFVTCKKYPGLFPDDIPVVRFLENKGNKVEPVVWDDHLIKWDDFNILVIRSVWDYHLNPERFMEWLEVLVSNNIKVLNPVKTMRGNLHKEYLLDYQDMDLPVIPTKLIRKNQFHNLSGLWSGNNYQSEIVIKPAISLNSHHTYKISRNEAKDFQKTFDNLVARQDLIIQPFIKEVESKGEISMIFINRQFSHAVVKKPAPGDFRVQSEYGGKVQPFDPSTSVKRQAEIYLEEVTGPLLYARVDGFIVENTFVLIEL